MKELFQAAAQEPWNNQKWNRATQHLGNLREAARYWEQWARDDDRRFDSLEVLIGGKSLEVEKLLLQWRASVAERKTWTLRLLRGQAKAGKGTWRRVSVWGDPKGWVTGKWHEWNSPTSSTYTEDSDVQFDWEPGDKIYFVLQAYGRTYNSNLIDDEVGGPLAIWLWQWWRYAADPTGENRVDVEIVDCPGPPPGWSQRLDPAELLGGSDK